jgi:hypothetical protein
MRASRTCMQRWPSSVTYALYVRHATTRRSNCWVNKSNWHRVPVASIDPSISSSARLLANQSNTARFCVVATDRTNTYTLHKYVCTQLLTLHGRTLRPINGGKATRIYGTDPTEYRYCLSLIDRSADRIKRSIHGASWSIIKLNAPSI